MIEIFFFKKKRFIKDLIKKKKKKEKSKSNSDSDDDYDSDDIIVVDSKNEKKCNGKIESIPTKTPQRNPDEV